MYNDFGGDGGFWLIELVVWIWRKLRGAADPAPLASAEGDSEVEALAAQADRDGLFHMMQQDGNLTPGLDAAGALAQMGDQRGVDHLIKTLSGDSAYLSTYAGTILQRLHDPRGDLALNTHPAADDGHPETPSEARGRLRQGLLAAEDVARSGDERGVKYLTSVSKGPDADLSAQAAKILERLNAAPANREQRAEPLDDEIDPEVRGLAGKNDREGLLDILANDSDWVRRLDAAEALAQVGDARGLDHLIRALDSSDTDEQEVAQEILEGLNEPRGTEALEAHQRLAPSSPLDAALEAIDHQDMPSRPASSDDVWAAYRQKQSALEAQHSLNASDAASPHALPVPVGTRPRSSNRVLFAGLVAAAIVWPIECLGGFIFPLASHDPYTVLGYLFTLVMVLMVSSPVAALLGAIGSAVVTRTGREGRSEPQLVRVGVLTGAGIGLVVGAAALVITYRLLCGAPGICAP